MNKELLTSLNEIDVAVFNVDAICGKYKADWYNRFDGEETSNVPYIRKFFSMSQKDFGEKILNLFVPIQKKQIVGHLSRSDGRKTFLNRRRNPEEKTTPEPVIQKDSAFKQLAINMERARKQTLSLEEVNNLLKWMQDVLTNGSDEEKKKMNLFISVYFVSKTEFESEPEKLSYFEKKKDLIKRFNEKISKSAVISAEDLNEFKDVLVVPAEALSVTKKGFTIISDFSRCYKYLRILSGRTIEDFRELLAREDFPINLSTIKNYEAGNLKMPSSCVKASLKAIYSCLDDDNKLRNKLLYVLRLLLGSGLSKRRTEKLRDFALSVQNNMTADVQDILWMMFVNGYDMNDFLCNLSLPDSILGFKAQLNVDRFCCLSNSTDEIVLISLKEDWNELGYTAAIPGFPVHISGDELLMTTAAYQVTLNELMEEVYGYYNNELISHYKEKGKDIKEDTVFFVEYGLLCTSLPEDFSAD